MEIFYGEGYHFAVPMTTHGMGRSIGAAIDIGRLISDFTSRTKVLTTVAHTTFLVDLSNPKYILSFLAPFRCLNIYQRRPWWQKSYLPYGG